MALAGAVCSALATILIRQGLRHGNFYVGFWINVVVGVVGFWTAVVRRIPFLFDIWPIDAAFLLFTARRQRAFDLAADTIVIAGGRRIGRPWGMVALLWLLAIGLGALAGHLASG